MAPPSLVSAMSMSVISQAGSNSFVATGPCMRQTGEGKTRPQKQLPAAVMASPDKMNSGSTLPPDLPCTCADRGELAAGLRSEAVKPGLTAEKYGSGKRILSREEISRHRNRNDAWIVVNGKVYNVTQFLDIHPGGHEVVLECLQSELAKDAGPLMRGEENEKGHSHSKAAFRILEQFLVGSTAEQPSSVAVEEAHVKKYHHHVDLTKPIVPQVGYLGADYDDWVHDPVLCKETPRFFENNVLEFFTKTKWWVIPSVWCPIAFAMIFKALMEENLALARLPDLMLLGAAIWTFIEYLMHRFLFHMKTSSYWGNTLHYILHGFHHKYPMDGARLVFPPGFTAVVLITLWIALGEWLFRNPTKRVLFGSGLLTYVVYDLTHYFLHFGNGFNDKSRQMKKYHLNHHFKDQKHGYGVTTSIWDFIFRTRPPRGVQFEDECTSQCGLRI